jgi:hypothetical protein
LRDEYGRYVPSEKATDIVRSFRSDDTTDRFRRIKNDNDSVEFYKRSPDGLCLRGYQDSGQASKRACRGFLRAL